MIDPLYPFVFAGLFSPGPNVIMITASGARFGLKRTLPHIAGIVVGVGITAGLTSLGIGAILLALPTLALAFQAIASVWILWMAWKLAQAKPAAQNTADRPFTFIEAALFQWINPKVWAVALAASSGFPGGLPPLEEMLRLSSAFSGINFFVCLFWTTAGSLLAYLLTTPLAWRTFNLVMAVALAVSALLGWVA